MSFGIDYAWGSPSISGLKQAGVKFVCRYISTPGNSKNIRADEARSLSAAGIDLVLVFETTAGRATGSASAGAYDARSALSQAKAVGMPDGRPIYFAVDFDGTLGQVDSYFDGVKSVLGVERTGVYGSYGICKDLYKTNRVKWMWQTYAWSGGAWYGPAQLQQYSNGHSLAGVSCDYDRSTARDFGQWRIGHSPAALPKHQYASRKLKQGMTGTDVRRLQAFINERLRHRRWPKIAADGVYGAETEKAKHWATYVLGLPTSVVKRDGATPGVQHYIRHPSERRKSYLDRARLRKQEKPEQFTPPKKGKAEKPKQAKKTAGFEPVDFAITTTTATNWTAPTPSTIHAREVSMPSTTVTPTKTVGVSPKAVLAFFYPLIATVIVSAWSWVQSGTFDTAEIKTVVGGLIASGLAYLGAYAGVPGNVRVKR